MQVKPALTSDVIARPTSSARGMTIAIADIAVADEAREERDAERELAAASSEDVRGDPASYREDDAAVNDEDLEESREDKDAENEDITGLENSPFSQQ